MITDGMPNFLSFAPDTFLVRPSKLPRWGSFEVNNFNLIFLSQFRDVLTGDVHGESVYVTCLLPFDLLMFPQESGGPTSCGQLGFPTCQQNQ